MILGVVPARSGSKGIPHKNIREVCGKPLIAYSIECGLNCSLIDHLIVNTDDETIAEVGRSWGAEVPFLRPQELAEDTTAMLPVMQHVVENAEEFYGASLEAMVLLQPTGPLRTVEDIEQSITLWKQTDCDAVVSAHESHSNPFFTMVWEKNGSYELVNSSEYSMGRRQDAPPIFDLNAIVWVYSRNALMVEKARLPKKTLIHVVPADRCLDVDTEFDLKILEFLLQQKVRKNG